MKTYAKYIFIIVSLLFLGVGIPIIINESYKTQLGYLTMWDAADVLSYYGTLLGSFITILSLISTIIFTQKQIKSERIREQDYQKWKKNEELLDQLIDMLNPLKISSFAAHTAHSNNIMERINELFTMKRQWEIAYDCYLCSVSKMEHQELDEIFACINELMIQTGDIVKKYAKHLESLNDIIESNNQTIRLIYNDSDICSETKNLRITAALDSFKIERKNKSNERHLIDEDAEIFHREAYQPLISRKCAVFSDIYKRINLNAENILHF